MRVSRYPRIPHLVPGPSTSLDDEVLDEASRARLLAGPLVVEEKLDGSNVWIALDEEQKPHAGGRSGSEESDRGGQLGRLRAWVFERADKLTAALSPGLTLYGEWLYLAHSIYYSRLSDYFVLVDIRRADGTFADRQERDRFCRRTKLVPAPLLYQGTLDGIESLLALHRQSTFGDAPAEGLIVRREDHGRVLERAKWVHSDYRRKTDAQWRASRRYNRLAAS